jgi:D-alanyl-D-alanine carboxypeptidase (penicillin-binding protein 5/6)
MMSRIAMLAVVAVIGLAPACEAHATLAAPASLAHRGVQAVAAPALVAHAAFILDDTSGRALYAYHADTPLYPASTIKMLTAILALQHLRLGAVLTVPSNAMVGGTSANLTVGERMTVYNLLHGLLVPSGNDAAVTLADAVAGSPSAFAALMNVEARSLGLAHSHFLGPDGLDLAGQYATARDLAWLAHALLRYPLLAGIVQTRVWRAASVDRRFSHVWTNLNHLLWSYPGACGVKTGTTPLAGANLVACAARGNRRIIAVVLGSTVASRFADATRLLNYGWRLLGRRSLRSAAHVRQALDPVLPPGPSRVRDGLSPRALTGRAPAPGR